MRDEFRVHMLNGDGLQKADAIAAVFSEALSELEAAVPAGRARSITITKLQEACFWAKRGVAEVPGNQM